MNIENNLLIWAKNHTYDAKVIKKTNLRKL